MNRSLSRSPKRGFLSVSFSKALTIGVLSVALLSIAGIALSGARSLTSKPAFADTT